VASSDLNEFVRDALTRGMPRGRVEEVLLGAGWSRDVVHGALAGYADVEFPIPVPRPKSYVSARETCLYLLLFSMLYIAAFNIGVLLFEFINHAFPDAARPTYAALMRSTVRWSLSSLMVTFPMFLYLSRVVAGSVRKDPVKRRSSVRRSMMYLTVFVAAFILIGDVTVLIYNALGGELTTRFLLKVATIAAITGTILSYYLADLRLEDTKPVIVEPHWQRLYGWGASIAVAAVIAVAFALIGSPSNERSRQLDARRVNDLRQISGVVDVYFGRYRRLPASLHELSHEGGMTVTAGDASLGQYEYRVTGEKTYELCATFQRDSSEQPWGDEFWAHGPGRQCYTPKIHAAN
jgi:Domain of unknown function (DUF5671)